MLDNNIVAVITNILALVIMLAFAAKALLIFSQVFVAIGRMILGFLHAVKRWRAECRKKEFLNTCQMMANMIETLSPAICEMAKNGVSINLDVAAFFALQRSPNPTRGKNCRIPLRRCSLHCSSWRLPRC